MTANPAEFKPARCAVLVVGQLEAAITCAERDSSAPGKRRLAVLDGAAIGIDGLRVAVEAVWITAQIRAHAFARLPRDTSRGLRSRPSRQSPVTPSPRTLYRCTMKSRRPPDCAPLQSARRRIQALKRHRRQFSVVQEFCDCGLRPGALHAVDRIGVKARNHQETLNAGKPRLHIVVIGFFRKVDDRSLRRV